MKPKTKYTLYKIEIDGIVRYYGYTNNIKNRTTRHNYLLNKGVSKLLYDRARELKITTLKLIPIYELESKVLAKRFEALFILKNMLEGEKTLWQKIPSISDI